MSDRESHQASIDASEASIPADILLKRLLIQGSNKGKTKQKAKHQSHLYLMYY